MIQSRIITSILPRLDPQPDTTTDITFISIHNESFANAPPLTEQKYAPEFLIPFSIEEPVWNLSDLSMGSKHWSLDKRWKVSHRVKRERSNWKLCMHVLSRKDRGAWSRLISYCNLAWTCRLDATESKPSRKAWTCSTCCPRSSRTPDRRRTFAREKSQSQQFGNSQDMWISTNVFFFSSTSPLAEYVFRLVLDITSLAYLERRERPSSLSRSSAERAKSWRVSLGRQFEHAFDLARDEDGGDEYAPTSAFHGEQPNSTRVRVDEGAMNCSRRLILIKSRNIIYDRRGQLVDAWLSDGANWIFVWPKFPRNDVGGTRGIQVVVPRG